MECGMRMRSDHLAEGDPILLVVDDGSSAAAQWQQRRDALLQLAPVPDDVTPVPAHRLHGRLSAFIPNDDVIDTLPMDLTSINNSTIESIIIFFLKYTHTHTHIYIDININISKKIYIYIDLTGLNLERIGN